jgi:alpha-tubulin suppressor-like RCC1 family protein
MPTFIDVAKGPRHSIGVTANGDCYSWGRTNALGQLGRDIEVTASGNPGHVPLPDGVKIQKIYVSNSKGPDSGHSAIIDDQGRLWMSGCDRWQQLGLGSSKGGSVGYTWQGGKMWQERFVLSSFITELMNEQSGTATIRDAALGGDHTIVLSSNKRDVYGFGKGGDGQFGFVGKPFVSAPRKSTSLSEEGVAAVCAIENCSMTLADNGEVKQKVGRCQPSLIAKGIQNCVDRARRHGLIQEEKNT